ncbi:hypothetical protein [Clavibacter capsici]|uniref:Uncharacterized protein n=1 Tax=Clavibacter capsici TaxID=1874630 RepID=A0AAE6XR33_9MICO|nr:hypothetical protein [Clavibacter capsici]QIS45682.1 hypothetical protein GW570_11590 [Clavibacter capsici]
MSSTPPRPAFRTPSFIARSHRPGRAGAGVAIVGVLAVVGSLAVGPTPARAAEVSTQAAEAAISASVSRGTYERDLVTGRITPEQVVDVTVAADTASGTAVADRDTLVQRATAEIAQLRADSIAESAPPAALSNAPVTESKSFWKKFKHWATLTVDSKALASAGGGAAGVLAVIGGTCYGFAVYVCAAVFALGAGAALGLFALAIGCVEDGQKYTYVKVPDFANSHCGN